MNPSEKMTLIYAVHLPQGPRLPIGLGYIAQALETAGVLVDVVDLNLFPEEDLLERIADFAPGFIGISIWNSCAGRAFRLLAKIREAFPAVRIIVGGPQVTLRRETVLEACGAIDIGVVGEGWETIVAILAGRAPSSIPGLLYREGNGVRFTGYRPASDPDLAPFPRFRSFSPDRYEGKRPLVSSYGCPHRCIYCSNAKSQTHVWRGRSSENLMEEVRFWYAKGCRAFQFQDSNLLHDRERMIRFCRMMVAEGMDCEFDARGIRADALDADLLLQMRQAGFRTLRIGVESGSDRVLRRLKKGETRRQIEKGISAAVEAGFDLVLYFLIGSPGERQEDIKASFDLARKYAVRKVNFFSLTPDPGTEYYDWAVTRNYWSEASPQEAFWEKAKTRSDFLSLEQLKGFLFMARLVEREVADRHRKRVEAAGRAVPTVLLSHPV